MPDHPCRSCEVFKRTGKNNGYECAGCSTPVDYDLSLGQAGYALGYTSPNLSRIAIIKRGRKKKMQEPATDILIKTCSKCGFMGEAEGNFRPNHRAKDGYVKICNTCMSERLKAGHAKKKAEKQEHEIKLLAKDTDGEYRPAESFEPEIGEQYNGKIDDVKIFPHALTEDAIANEYDQTETIDQYKKDNETLEPVQYIPYQSEDSDFIKGMLFAILVSGAIWTVIILTAIAFWR
jgi:hypothetical protein